MVLAKLKTRSLLSNRRADCTKYAYDASQNRKLIIDSGARTTYTCDAANQLNWLQDGTGRTTYSYDNNGNQTLRISSALARATYAWDGDNRLVSVAIPDTVVQSIFNNFLGYCVTLVNSVTTNITWDGSSRLLECTILPASSTCYTFDTMLSAIMSSRSSQSLFSHCDGYGSTSQLTNSNANNYVSYIFRRDGRSLSESDSDTNIFRFKSLHGYVYNIGLYTYSGGGYYLTSIAKWVQARAMGRFVPQLPPGQLGQNKQYQVKCPKNTSDNDCICDTSCCFWHGIDALPDNGGFQLCWSYSPADDRRSTQHPGDSHGGGGDGIPGFPKNKTDCFAEVLIPKNKGKGMYIEYCFKKEDGTIKCCRLTADDFDWEKGIPWPKPTVDQECVKALKWVQRYGEEGKKNRCPGDANKRFGSIENCYVVEGATKLVANYELHARCSCGNASDKYTVISLPGDPKPTTPPVIDD